VDSFAFRINRSLPCAVQDAACAGDFDRLGKGKLILPAPGIYSFFSILRPPNVVAVILPHNSANQASGFLRRLN
jgi:hypothetical protein